MNQNCLAALDRAGRLVESSARVMIVSDFDGTLCPIADRPGMAALSPAMFDLLERLASSPGAALVIVSGRSLRDLAARTPAGAILAGNHGLEIEGAGLRFEHPGARDARPCLAAAGGALRDELVRWPGAWLEDKRLTATVHYRNAEPRLHRHLLFAIRKTLAPFGASLAMRAGKKALEIRPRLDWSKADVVEWIRDRIGPFDACIRLGDGESISGAGEREVVVRTGYRAAGAMEAGLVLANVVGALGRRPAEATSRLCASG